MSEWYPDARELIRELRLLAHPYCGSRLERYNELMEELLKWCESGDKALRMENDDRLRIKFYTCRRIWKIRNEPLPNKSDDAATWAEWFKVMFHQSLDDFVRIAKETNLREKVRAYELARFGSSPLEEAKTEKAA